MSLAGSCFSPEFGGKALPSWDSRTRWNNLCRGTIAHRVEITSLAARHHLPAVYPYRFFAEVGGLLSYGIDETDNFRRAATYADRILKGANPSELPVQAPVKFELVINLKAATALGLTVPPAVLARADAVIE
jgi:putative tryptophan/tyrosine transport system substrate-binding protein